MVIPNGYVVRSRDEDVRARVRAELQCPPSAVLIGRIGRFHAHKGIHDFVDAAAIVAEQRPDARFVLCGAGLTRDNPQLATWIAATTHPNRFLLLGERADMDPIYYALDIACSSSIGEGFPNVVAEAMALGLPVVATDVGDSALVVGDAGRVVPPRQPIALATALLELIAVGREGRATFGIRASEHIDRRYSLDMMVAAYESLYETLASTMRTAASFPPDQGPGSDDT